MSDTLVSFDERSLLNELLSCRIFVNFGGQLAFKYRIFYSYFLGRHVAARSALLGAFMEHDAYLSAEGLVEVITALSGDNSSLISDIVSKLESALTELNERFPLGKLDPFTKVDWPANEKEEEQVWQPVSDALVAGPLAGNELDKLKRSIEAERRTEDQVVLLYQVDKLERKIVAYFTSLMAAMINSDSLDGEEKKRALRAVLGAGHLRYMIGVLYSSLSGRHNFFFWNGVVFHKFAGLPGEGQRKTVNVAAAMPIAVSKTVTAAIGTKKLGEVYRALGKH